MKPRRRRRRLASPLTRCRSRRHSCTLNVESGRAERAEAGAGQIIGRPGSGTAQPLSAGPGESASTSLPGQTAVSVISPGPAEGYISTGATGTGHADHWPRYDWQSQPERNR